jgi:hypothetical protein
LNDNEQKKRILLVATGIAVISTFMVHPFAQSPAFHNFADKRSFLNIPNFSNVISNIPFLVFGIYGLLFLVNARSTKGILPIYTVMFLGILLTGIGSGYYHYAPDNDSLVFDRIPLTLVFMALLSATSRRRPGKEG